MLLSSYWSAFILYFILRAPATASSRPRDAAEARTRASSHRDKQKKKDSLDTTQMLFVF